MARLQFQSGSFTTTNKVFLFFSIKLRYRLHLHSLHITQGYIVISMEDFFCHLLQKLSKRIKKDFFVIEEKQSKLQILTNFFGRLNNSAKIFANLFFCSIPVPLEFQPLTASNPLLPLCSQLSDCSLTTTLLLD